MHIYSLVKAPKMHSDQSSFYLRGKYERSVLVSVCSMASDDNENIAWNFQMTSMCTSTTKFYSVHKFCIQFNIFGAKSYNSGPFGSLLFKWLHNAQILLAIREAHTHRASYPQFKFPVCWVSSIDMIFSESNRHSHIINFPIHFDTHTHTLTASMQSAISIENICKPSVHQAHTRFVQCVHFT